MNALEEIQTWYLSQCDGDWEHGEGITIETLDNPGWRVKISLRDTNLESKSFQEVSNLERETDWIRCWVEDGMFHGAGGPKKLGEILRTFLNWTKTA